MKFSEKILLGCIVDGPRQFFVRIPAKELEGAKNLRVDLLDDTKRKSCEPYLDGVLRNEWGRRVDRHNADPQRDYAQLVKDWREYTRNTDCVKVFQSALGANNLIPFVNFYFDAFEWFR